LNIDKVIEIIKLFKPSFYNKITWAIVISGLALLGTSLLERILNAILEKEYNLTITDDKDSIFGFSLVVIALIYNIITVYFDKFLIQKQDNLIILEQKEVDKELYLKLGKPTFLETFRSDIGEELTWKCEEMGYNVCLSYPTEFYPLTDEEMKNRIANDPHSPGMYRVNGPLKNCPEFFNAFSIEENRPMRNSSKKIAKIW
jgi:hypothetical protein